mmetsp:Transcript_58752/g.110051  ORF Transcript_58752/g.110051 Transcript_58752/m.110051 type:complete len:171 (+) Transcript_58752:89-601(+)
MARSRSASALLVIAVCLAGFRTWTFATSPGSRQSALPRRAEKGSAMGGIQGKEQFDGILDELAEAAAAEDEAKGDVVVEEDGWAWFKQTFSWVLTIDVFILIFLSGWLFLGATLNQFFNYEPVIASFMMYWDPYFQSLLGILFASRLVASLTQWLLKAGAEDDDAEFLGS